jgi:hypothetical protein
MAPPTIWESKCRFKGKVCASIDTAVCTQAVLVLYKTKQDQCCVAIVTTAVSIVRGQSLRPPEL